MICTECGARLASDATECDLCGYPVSPGQESDARADTEAVSAEPSSPAGEAGPASSILCPACGAKNAAGARFCNQCGTAVAEAGQVESDQRPGRPARAAGAGPGRPAEAQQRQPAASSFLARRGTMMLGVGLMVVVLLYAITHASQRYAPADGQPAQVAEAPVETPVDAELAESARPIEEAIEAATDPAQRHEQRQELIALYRNAGRFDKAGEVQQQIAEEVNDAESWIEAGNHYYDWMVTREDRGLAAAYSRKTAEAYKRALELDPENLNVRTDLAVAYLYDPSNPMAGVEEITKVLEADPEHVQANFNYGIMLAQIGRQDQAVEQFEKVIALTAHDDPQHMRAMQALQSLSGASGR